MLKIFRVFKNVDRDILRNSKTRSSLIIIQIEAIQIVYTRMDTNRLRLSRVGNGPLFAP